MLSRLVLSNESFKVLRAAECSDERCDQNVACEALKTLLAEVDTQLEEALVERSATRLGFWIYFDVPRDQMSKKSY